MTQPLTRDDALAFLREHYFTPGEIACAEGYECEATPYLTAAAADPLRRFCDKATDICFDSHPGGGVSVWRPYRWGPGVKPDFVISFNELAKACAPQPVVAVEEPMQRSMF